MADDVTTGAIAAAAAGVVVALKEVGMWIVRAIRGNTKAQIEQTKAEDQARAEDREREIANKESGRVLDAIRRLRDELRSQAERNNSEHTQTREQLARMTQQLSDGNRRMDKQSEKLDKHLEGHG